MEKVVKQVLTVVTTLGIVGHYFFVDVLKLGEQYGMSATSPDGFFVYS